jgi:hypothetical protein
MDPNATGRFVEDLKAGGLDFIRSEKCVDVVVIDQLRGPTKPCDWVEFARIRYGDSGDKVSVAWLFEGPRMAAGIHLPGKKLDIATPAGWRFERSLSKDFHFVANDDPTP